MKILCEVPIKVTRFDKSQFHWLKSKENFMFTFENGKRLRMFNIRQDAGLAQEVQSASLAESRSCSGLSWNRDESLLALVVDRKLIYIWDVKRNIFSHFKPRIGQVPVLSGGSIGSSKASTADNVQMHRKVPRTRDIELIAWSKISDRLAICYSSGQILLCQVVKAAPTGTSGGGGEEPQQTESDEQQGYLTNWERFIDNSESVLKRIVSIEVSEHAELFACFSVISEILIMSFDGQTKFYCQGERTDLFNAKFSPLRREYGQRSGQYLGQSLSLACQSEVETGGLYMKKISLDMEHELQDLPPRLYVPCESTDEQNVNPRQKTRLINFYWLKSTHLLLCLESGSIQLVQIVKSSPEQDKLGSIISAELFKISTKNAPNPLSESGLMTPISTSSSRSTSRNQMGHKGSDAFETGSVASEFSISNTSTTTTRAGSSVPTTTSSNKVTSEQFKLFELIKISSEKHDCSQRFALAAATNYKMFYYELYESKNSTSVTSETCPARDRFSFEHFDDIDLRDSLQRVNLELERASWTRDGSMLSLQVTSGHLLVYKMRLQNSLIASFGSKTAFLSSPDEVTILNYGTSSSIYGMDNTELDERTDSSVSSQAPNHSVKSGENAIILSVQLKPSLLAIGPNHLALALNNRVRFYPLDGRHQASKFGDFYREEEYLTIVIGISLSSRFVAVQFDDERLKLHSIGQNAELKEGDELEPSGESLDNERFFPDPSQPETISAFTLTEELLVFCTNQCRIRVFSLADWQMAQTCDHSTLFKGPIERLKPNERGNQFVCLVQNSTESSRSRQQETVLLYDLYSNDVINLLPRDQDQLWPKLVEKQIVATLEMLTFNRDRIRSILGEYKFPASTPEQLGGVVDAIWDTDGRTLLLVEAKFYHVFVILCHTLSSEGPVCEYSASARKPANYTTLYISQGVVSYQTGLGRVINSILETHDDELELTKLEQQIQAIKENVLKLSKDAPSEQSGGHDNEETTIEDTSNPDIKMDRTIFLEAHLRIVLLKVDYLCTILPIYSLPKCRDICKHFMEEEAFNLNLEIVAIGEYLNEFKLINQMIAKLLAAWSLFTLNLNFAALIYKRNDMQVHLSLMQNLLNDIKTRKMDSRSWVNSKILSILGFGTLNYQTN